MRALAAWLALACAGPALGQDAEHGAQIAGLAGCAACHTAPGGETLAGGYAVVTPFGTFYGSNLTPDPDTGLGRWSFEDFVRAMRVGKSPEGRPYYPAFPYPAFSQLTDADLADLWAWLQAVAPVAQDSPPHEVVPRFRGRSLLGTWRLFSFRQGPFEPDPQRDEAWNRGAYLVRGAGHCGECHTPRNGIGGLRRGRELAGSRTEPEPGPNLTPGPGGLQGWSVDDLVTLLDMGMTPEGDFVGGEMGRIVDEGTARLSEADRRAIATYLLSLPPR